MADFLLYRPANSVALNRHQFINKGSLNIQHIQCYFLKTVFFNIVSAVMFFEKFLNICFKSFLGIWIGTNTAANFKLNTICPVAKPHIHTFTAIGALRINLLRFRAYGHYFLNLFNGFVTDFIAFIHSQESQINVLGKTLDRTRITLTQRSATFEYTFFRIFAVSQVFQEQNNIIIALYGRLR